MMDRYSGFFLIIHLIRVPFLDAYTQSCNASLETVVQVTKCPTSNASYIEAARQKNCSSLPLDKTGCQSFQYHCVLSEDLNAIFEVCAPSINIIGYVCAKFSSKFKSIMRVYDHSCGNSTAGCPYYYNSTLAFMYQQCYTKNYNMPTTGITPRLIDSTTKELSTKGLENSKNQSWIAAAVIVPILLIVVAAIGIIYWKKKKRKKAKDNQQNRRGDIDVEMDEVRIDNRLQNRDLVDPLLRVNNIEVEKDGNELSAEVKTEVSTEVRDKRILLESAVNSLIESLKFPNKTWKRETITAEIQNLFNKIQDAGDRQLLMEFVKKLNKDPEIQRKLTECEVEMHQMYLSVLHKYDATKLSIDKGCVCFLMNFSDDKPLKKFLNDFLQGDKDFIRHISGILLNKKFLSIFQIHPEIVTWKSSGIKIYEGSKLLQEENLEVPLIGTYNTTEDDKGKENADELKLEGVFRFAKIVMAIENNLAQIYKDLLDMEVPHGTVVAKVKTSNIYEKLSQEENEILSKAVEFGYDEFKIPLMYKLLRHICFKIPKPTKGWGLSVWPSAEDISVGDDIERIKYFRNYEFGTISEPVSQESFDRYWTHIIDICQRMQRYTGKSYLKDLHIIHGLLLEEMEKEMLMLTREIEKGVPKLTPKIQSDKLAEMQLELRGRFKEEERTVEDFNVTPNKYPAYHQVKTRELSFESCGDTSLKERAPEFARDGFFYEGYGLVTTCFHCGIQKGDWKEEDNIHAEHVKLKEACDYAKFVQLHILKSK